MSGTTRGDNVIRHPASGKALPPGGSGPDDPDMEARVARLEAGFAEVQAAIARIERGQSELASEVRDLRRELRETELPGIRAQLAGLDAGLKEKPSGKDYLALAQSLNGTLYKAFGLCVTLLVAGAGILAWLHKQGVL
jgi:hypothetical protein